MKATPNILFSEGFLITELRLPDGEKLGLNENCPDIAVQRLNHHLFQYLNNYQNTPGNISKHYKCSLINCSIQTKSIFRKEEPVA